MHTFQSEDAAAYSVAPKQPEIEHGLTESEWVVVAQALELLRKCVNRQSVLDSPVAVKQYLTLRAAKYEVEVFSVLYLDARHRPIAVVDLHTGTLTQTSVYPREVVRHALRLNAAACIITHNHPSGCPSPSEADKVLTRTLKNALALVDVRLLDHIITAAGDTYGFAESGLI
jgi:DNA repair protein RadC